MDAYLNEVVRYLAAQSWQIAVLTVAVAAVTLALRHRSAHVRYLLWLIVLAKCLVPPLYMVPLRILPPVTPSGVSDSLLQPDWPVGRSGASTPTSPEESAVQVQESTPPAQIRQVGEPRLSVSGSLGIIWVSGAGACLTMNLLRALRGHHWLRKTRRPLPEDVQADAANLLRSYGVRHLPRIWIMEGVGQPFVWGLLRGSIYVPPGFRTIESPVHRRDILAHELSHVLRLDAAVNALQVIAQGLFWFHPFVWWANKRIRIEREKCCDEMAVARLGAPPKDYCNAVVEALADAKRSIRPAPSLAIAGSLKSIEARIRTMLRPGRRFHARPSLAVAAIAVLVALVAVPTTLVLTARAEMPPTTQSEDRPAPSVNETAVARGESRQPPFAARTFNSEIAFDVFAQETPPASFSYGRFLANARWLGRTPSVPALEVPDCWLWWVAPSARVKDWDGLVRTISENGVPGLQLSAATDSEVKHLAGLTSLQHLSLAGSNVTDADLACLKGLTGLRTLELSGTRITEAGLAHLRSLTGLRELSLCNTRITDTSVEYLEALTELQYLDLRGTQITEAGFRQLQRSLRTSIGRDHRMSEGLLP